MERQLLNQSKRKQKIKERDNCQIKAGDIIFKSKRETIVKLKGERITKSKGKTIVKSKKDTMANQRDNWQIKR